jgi:hypothetical protein
MIFKQDGHMTYSNTLGITEANDLKNSIEVRAQGGLEFASLFGGIGLRLLENQGIISKMDFVKGMVSFFYENDIQENAILNEIEEYNRINKEAAAA